MQILPPRSPPFGAAFSCREGARMALTKPPQVENDEFKSAKWDELTQGRAQSMMEPRSAGRGPFLVRAEYLGGKS